MGAKKEWIAFAVAVVGLLIWRSDFPMAARVGGYLLLVVGALAELAFVVGGYLRRRSGRR